MRHKVRFAVEAQQQLDAIESYIGLASGHPAVAERFVDDIVDHRVSFETFPERGTQRDDLLPGLRTVGYRRRITIAFRLDAANAAVTILDVFYDGQGFEAGIAPTEPGNG